MPKIRLAVAGHEIEVEALAELSIIEDTVMRLYNATVGDAARTTMGFDLAHGHFDLAEVAGDVVRAP